MEKDVELYLEVLVDPASKKILCNPEKCHSALLDVTLIKPKEPFGTQRTNTLHVDEVRQLIASLERQKRKRQKLLSKLKEDDTIVKIRKHDESSRPRKQFSKYQDKMSSQSPYEDFERKDFIGITESVEPLFCEIRRSLKNVETRITNMQDINLVISHNESDDEYVFYRNNKRANSLQQAVYRVEADSKNLRSLLCKNKLLEYGNKLEKKCICENCGLVGFLTECQKRPLLNELAKSPPPSHHTQLLSREMKTHFSISNVDSLKSYDSYIDQLSDRVKLLEERLSAHEEKVVAKDYFKQVVSKVLNNVSGKSNTDTSMCYMVKNTKKRLTSKRVIPDSPQSTCTQICKSTHNLKCNKPAVNLKKSRQCSRGTETSNDVLYDGYIWRWGEEILKPGIDLKDRIAKLLTEMLSKSVNEQEQISQQKYEPESLKAVVKEFQTKVFNTHINTNPKVIKNYEGRLQPPFDYSKRSGDTKNLKTHRVKKEQSINASYVNPKSYCEERKTPNVIKQDVSEGMSNVIGRKEFFKIVSKAKQNQKDILWKNIWNQAKANGQTKDDKITIKIPCQNKNYRSPKLFTTELKIGEVEKILKI